MAAQLERTSSISTSPLNRFLASFPDAKRNDSGYYANKTPHFDFWEVEGGDVKVKIWNGAPLKEVLAQGNPPLAPRDLYTNAKGYRQLPGGSPSAKRDPLTIKELAWAKRLPVNELLTWGCEDEYTYTTDKGYTFTGVKLGVYQTPDGLPHTKNRVQLTLRHEKNGPPKFIWDKNTPGEIIPCGLQSMGLARELGYTVLGEGESDEMTAAHHGIPFIGIPGADMVKKLDVSLLLEIPIIYILVEPDQAAKNQSSGCGFYADMRAHLREGGYEGDIMCIPWKQATGEKDPNDLHKRLYDESPRDQERVHARFIEIVEQAMLNALPEGNDEIINQDATDIESSERAAIVAQETQFALLPSLRNSTDGFNDLMHWILKICAVPGDTMAPAAKILLIVLVVRFQLWSMEVSQLLRLDSYELAEQTGLSADTIKKQLALVVKTFGFFYKDNEIKSYPTDSKNGKKQWGFKETIRIGVQNVSLLSNPDQWQNVPGARQRKHGGKREELPVQIAIQEQPEPEPEPEPEQPDLQTAPTCINCGSDEIDRAVIHTCRSCNYSHFLPSEQMSYDPSREQWIPETQFTLETWHKPSTTVTPTDKQMVEGSIADAPIYRQDAPTYEESLLHRQDAPTDREITASWTDQFSSSSEKPLGLCEICKWDSAFETWHEGKRYCKTCKSNTQANLGFQ